MAVLGKKIFEGGGAGPSSFRRQQWLSEITIEPIKNLGLGASGPNIKPPLLHTSATEKGLTRVNRQRFFHVPSLFAAHNKSCTNAVCDSRFVKTGLEK